MCHQFPKKQKDHIKLMKLTTHIIDQQAETCFSSEPNMRRSTSSQETTKPPTYPFVRDIIVKEPATLPEGLEAIGGEVFLRHLAAGGRGYRQIRLCWQQVF